MLRMREWKTSLCEVKTAERVDNHRRSRIIEHNLRGALLSGGQNPVILSLRGREKGQSYTSHAKSSAFVTRIQLIIVGSIDPRCSSMTIIVRFIPQVVFPDARVIARNYGLCLRKALKNYGTVAVIHF